MEVEGWYAIRIQSGLARGVTRGTFINLGKKGRPDWIFVRGPVYLFAELKRPGKKLSPDQVEWFEQAERDGLRAIWADGIDVFKAKYKEQVDG